MLLMKRVKSSVGLESFFDPEGEVYKSGGNQSHYNCGCTDPVVVVDSKTFPAEDRQGQGPEDFELDSARAAGLTVSQMPGTGTCHTRMRW